MMFENVCWTLRMSAVSSGPSRDDVGRLDDAGDEVGVLLLVALDRHPLAALDEDPQRPVGDLEHPRDDARHADVVEVVRAAGSPSRGRGRRPSRASGCPRARR